jgi:hypothetical protein
MGWAGSGARSFLWRRELKAMRVGGKRSTRDTRAAAYWRGVRLSLHDGAWSVLWLVVGREPVHCRRAALVLAFVCRRLRQGKQDEQSSKSISMADEIESKKENGG